MVALNGTLVVSTGSGVFSSPDSGTSWNCIDSVATDLNDLVVVGNDLFASSWKHAVVHSLDAGLSWDTVNDSLPSGTDFNQLIAYRGSLVGCTQDGVFLCLGKDSKWEQIFGTSDITGIAATNDRLYVLTRDSYVYVTSDTGKTWRETSPPGNAGGPSLCISAVGDQLFLSTNNHVFSSPNGGQSWKLIDDGLQTGENAVFALIPLGDYLYASTSWVGLYRRALLKFGRVSSHETIQDTMQVALSLGTLNVWSQVPMRAVELLDLTGRCVAALQCLPTQSASFTVRGLSSGVYVLRVYLPDGIASRKIIYRK